MDAGVKTCPECGAEAAANARFCMSCGHILTDTGAATAPAQAEPDAQMADTSTDASDQEAPSSVVYAPVGSLPDDGREAASLTSEAGDADTEDAVADGVEPETPSSPAVGEEQPAGDSWYDSLSTSPAGTVPGEVFAGPGREPQADTTSTGTPTLNMNAPEALPEYSPPPQASAGTNLGYTPPPEAGGGGYTGYTPPPPAYSDAPMGQAHTQQFYSPPPQAAQGQPTTYYAPPPAGQITQYGQAQPPAQGYGGYPQSGYPQQAGVAPKDPTIALLLELIGYAGILGVGHIYAGYTNRGIALLIGWLVYLGAATVLSFVCVGCLMFLLWPIVPILSGLWVKNEMEKARATGMYQ